MTKPNFQAMTTSELRAYVLANREDNEAFHVLSDRIRENGKPITLEELERKLQQKEIK
jgi:hypothetical protein